MKSVILFFMLCLVSYAQDAKDTTLVFTNKADAIKWNTYQLPLGTNVTTQWYSVTKTNDLVVIIPTNAVTKLVQDGRITDSGGGKIDPVSPKAINVQSK